jgi:hypothetical protein
MGTRKKTTLRRIALLVGMTFVTGFAVLWPWIRLAPRRFLQLDQYLVYEAGRNTSPIDGVSQEERWREPRSRAELLTRPEHEVVYRRAPHFEVALAPEPAKPKRPPPPSVQFQPGDALHDFIVERSDRFVRPESQKELDEAITAGKAQRVSSFFQQYFGLRRKPFFGELPTSICFESTGGGGGVGRMSRLQVRKGYEWVDASLDTPPGPEAFVVAAAGPENAQRSMYERREPVAHQSDEFWAIVYAGPSRSSPAAFVLDRVEVDHQSVKVSLHRPVASWGTMDSRPYWFFIPLGRLPEGRFLVDVRDADRGEKVCSTTVTLRYATENEEAKQNAEGERQQIEGNRYYERKRQAESHVGGDLQVRLERLAEYLADANVTSADRALLLDDVKKLGASVDWLQNVYKVPNHDRRRLAEAEDGVSPDLAAIDLTWDYHKEPWRPANISLKNVWLCDGTDADWFVNKHYRRVPEFEGALAATDPTPVQQKIREIWKALEERAAERGVILSTLAVGGSINEALDATHQYLVDGVEPARTAAADKPIWVAFVARRSFLVRQVLTRYYEDKYSKTKRTEFMVLASAFLNEKAEDAAPVTFGLIELGFQPAGHSVGIPFSCRSICGRGIETQSMELVDAMPPQMLYSDFCGYLPYGTHIQIDPVPSNNAGSSSDEETENQ